MSSKTTGAASAAPITPEEAERQLGAATTPEQAWRIYEYAADREEGWRVIKLKAERRYGELLGEGQVGRPKGNVSSRHISNEERQVRKQARKVAAVPQERFDSYIAEHGVKSTREGLLREVTPKQSKIPKDQQRKYRNNLWENDDVIAWVARRMKAGKTRDEIEAESKGGTHGWPLPGRWLPRNTVDICRHIINDRKRRGDNNRPRKKESNKRLRQLYDDRRSGKRHDNDIWKLQRAIWQAASEVEWFLLPDLDWDEDTQDTVQQILDDLRRLDDWTQGAINATIARMDDLGKQRTIHKLRVAADDQTATQGERENAVRMLIKLQRKRAMTG